MLTKKNVIGLIAECQSLSNWRSQEQCEKVAHLRTPLLHFARIPPT